MTDLELAEAAVRAGGREALRRFRAQTETRVKRSDSDPVSDADIAAQRVIVETIARHRPDDGLLAEEGGLSVERDRRWLIDPIDGTLAFIAGQPLWCSAACLQDRGGDVAAAVYDAVADELFSAERGDATTLNGARARVRSPRALRSAVVRVWCDPHVAARRAFLPALARLANGSAALQAGGSGSQALAWLACGRLDGWVELYPHGEEKAWDWHPGALLVTRAGGCVRVAGEWRIAAASEALAEELSAAVEDRYR